MNSEELTELLSRHEGLAERLAADGVVLGYDAVGVALVEDRIDGWRGDPRFAPQLSNEIGLYLGSVIVASVPGAAWTVWPNGHPVVTVPNRREVDVVALGAERVFLGYPLADLAAGVRQRLRLLCGGVSCLAAEGTNQPFFSGHAPALGHLAP